MVIYSITLDFVDGEVELYPPHMKPRVALETQTASLYIVVLVKSPKYEEFPNVAVVIY